MGKIYDVKVELVRKTKEQFESDRIALAATPDEGEDIGALIADMKAAILGQMTKNLVGSSITEKVEVKKTSNSKQAGTPISDEKPLQSQEKVNAESNGNDSGSSSSSTSEKAGEQETSGKKASGKKADEKSDGKKADSKEASKESGEEKVTEKAEGKVKGKKTVQYDRELATHKDMLGTFLDEKVGKKWRAGTSLTKAAKISMALHKEGTPFLDGSGEILESFTTEFLKRFESEE